MKAAIIAISLAFIACGPTSQATGGGGDGGTAPTGPILRLAPQSANVTVPQGGSATQAYTATRVDVDGTETDVTASAQFSFANGTCGTFSGATASANGGCAGPATVTASVGTVTGSATLNIMATLTANQGTAPATAAQMFATATETAGLAPTIAYPADGIIAPPNLGAFDVHWTASSENLFAIELSNQYIDFTLYTTGQPGAKWWTQLTPDEWAEVAGTQLPLKVTVAGLNTSTPTAKGTSTPITVNSTHEGISGGVYYFSISGALGAIYRYDTSTPTVAPSNYYANGKQPNGGCVGCHAISKDGSKMALTEGPVPGNGAVVDVASQSIVVPDSVAQWDFATFNVDNTKLITVAQNDPMTLRSAAGGAAITTVPSSPGVTVATDPEISPDGTLLVNVESTADSYEDPIEGEGPSTALDPGNGSVVVRTFDDTSNMFGAIKTVIADGVGGLSSYYPSFSPDGQWLVVTRVAKDQYAEPDSTVWIVKADGSAPPIQLAAANTSVAGLENSWARWAPFPQTDANGKQLYYITFTSVRTFGTRLPQGTEQLWMAPFYPDRAAAGMDPSGPAFHLPFQDVTQHNHSAQWTQAIVQIQ